MNGKNRTVPGLGDTYVRGLAEQVVGAKLLASLGLSMGGGTNLHHRFEPSMFDRFVVQCACRAYGAYLRGIVDACGAYQQRGETGKAVTATQRAVWKQTLRGER